MKKLLFTLLFSAVISGLEAQEIYLPNPGYVQPFGNSLSYRIKMLNNETRILHWDSACSYGADNYLYRKYYRHYDASGRPVYEMVYNVILDSSLQKAFKTEFTFDTQGNLIDPVAVLRPYLGTRQPHYF